MHRPQKVTYIQICRMQSGKTVQENKTFEDYTTSSAVAHSMDQGSI